MLIFTFYIGVPDNTSLPYPALLPITYVCRHWRTIALSHAPLWTSITCGLSLRWIKAFMEHSRTMLMDINIPVASPWPDTRTGLCREDAILLLTDFTRVHSLCLTGSYRTIRTILDSLCRSLPIQSLSLCLHGIGWHSSYTLPDDLFGGNAPIRRLQLIGTGHIVTLNWLLRGVTHFTSSELITLPQLLDVLRQMSALAHFEFRPGRLCRWKPVVDKLRGLPIQMPQLMNFIVQADSPNEFILVNQLLLLHVGAKRWLELPVSVFQRQLFDVYYIDNLSPVVEAANGFQHIHFSEARKEGWFHLWTGNAVTTWEDAEFCLCVEWKAPEVWLSRENLRSFVTFCDAIGAALVRKLVIDSPSPSLQKSYWWKILEGLPGVEELELYPTCVDALGGAWKAKRASRAPAVLPALRRVQIVDSELNNSSPQYSIIGDPPARRIVQLPSSTEDNVAPFPEVVSAEKELENLSKGLLRLLQGSSRQWQW